MTQATNHRLGRGRLATKSSWRLYGDEVHSDIVGCDYPVGTGEAPSVTVSAMPTVLPPCGDLLRRVGGERGSPLIQLFRSNDGYRYEVDRVGSFWIDSTGSDVRYRLSPQATIADFDHFLAGPVLGLAYQLRGGVALHAGAIVVRGRAVGFAAPHGSGKSTLAMGLNQMGYPLLTDDVLPLRHMEDSWQALHSLPRAKLWEDSLAALGHSSVELPQVTSWVSKRRIPLGRAFGTIETSPVPMGALYLLDPRVEDLGIRVARLAPGDAVFELLSHTYMPEALTSERSFAVLTAMCDIVERVPVRRITYQRSYDVISKIRDQFVADADWD